MARWGWRWGLFILSAAFLAGLFVAGIGAARREDTLPAGMPEFVEVLPEEAGFEGEPLADLPPERVRADPDTEVAMGQICVLGSLVAGSLIVLGLQMYGPGHRREDGCA